MAMGEGLKLELDTACHPTAFEVRLELPTVRGPTVPDNGGPNPTKMALAVKPWTC
jgi:hypothetical protein